MERHASFRDWRLSQGVKRLTDPRPCGRKMERKVVENARGGELEAYRRERAGWIGKKEERERERETGIIVGKDGGWMLSFGDACIIVYVTWLERIVQRDTEPSGVRLQQRVRRRITTRAIKNFNTTIIMYFCQKEDWSTVISTKLHPASLSFLENRKTWRHEDRRAKIVDRECRNASLLRDIKPRILYPLRSLYSLALHHLEMPLEPYFSSGSRDVALEFPNKNRRNARSGWKIPFHRVSLLP